MDDHLPQGVHTGNHVHPAQQFPMEKKKFCFPALPITTSIPFILLNLL